MLSLILAISVCLSFIFICNSFNYIWWSFIFICYLFTSSHLFKFHNLSVRVSHLFCLLEFHICSVCSNFVCLSHSPLNPTLSSVIVLHFTAVHINSLVDGVYLSFLSVYFIVCFSVCCARVCVLKAHPEGAAHSSSQRDLLTPGP